MFLSTEQTRAVMHGVDNGLSWHEIDRPVGPHHTPEWCRGVHVNWMEGYTNSPRVTLKVTCNVREWDNKRFRKEGHYYRAYHPDGRVEQYAHNGAVALCEVALFQRPDGSLHRNIRWGEQWAEPNPPGVTTYPKGGHEPGEWVKAERLATTQQSGFGGDVIWLDMEDGQEIALRGPWHVGAPEGYAEVAYVDPGKSDAYSDWYARKGKPWHHRTARGGLYLSNDTFTVIMARFAPHLPLASVTYGGCTTVEPLRPEWGEPKRLVYEREWLARKAARDAAKSEVA